MALAVYVDSGGRRKTARMFPPRRVTQEVAWLKAARMVIPEIPDVRVTSWYVAKVEVEVGYIKFGLLNGMGEFATVLIDRTVRSF